MTILSSMVGLSRDLHCHQGRYLVGHGPFLFKLVSIFFLLFLLSSLTVSRVQLQ